MQCPCAPAFITTAPPIVPGIPTAHSRPWSPDEAAFLAKLGSVSPLRTSMIPEALSIIYG